MKLSKRLLSLTILLLIMPCLFIEAQEDRPPSDPYQNISKRVTSIVTVDENNRIVRNFVDLDTTRQTSDAYLKQLTPIDPLNTMSSGMLSGRAQIWFNSNWIYGEGDTWLNSSNGITYKIEAWTSSLNVNGTPNANGRLNIKYTSAAYDNVFAGNIGSDSGCLVVNLSGLKRTAKVNTDHKRYRKTGGLPLNSFPNSASLSFSCTGE
jgi:hypothetical protein